MEFVMVDIVRKCLDSGYTQQLTFAEYSSCVSPSAYSTYYPVTHRVHHCGPYPLCFFKTSDFQTGLLVSRSIW